MIDLFLEQGNALVPIMVKMPHYRIQMIPTFQLAPELTCSLVVWMTHEVTQAEERFKHVAKRFGIAKVHFFKVSPPIIIRRMNAYVSFPASNQTFPEES